MTQTMVDSSGTRVLPPEFDRRYPVVVRGDGVWLEDSSGRRYLDAMSGGSMAATLGHGRRDLVEAARRQALRLAYVHNERLTNPLQERLARELVDVAPAGFARVRFVTGGAEANELAIRLARAYHVERGEPSRWQIVSQAQAYHGPTMETLALTGRSGPARVAWKAGTALPVVQCLRLRTTGNPLGGYTVDVTGFGEPTALDEPC